jgi:hypothetical protein
MKVTDYYEIMGLQSDATIDEIKKAYRNKARIYHPDINPSPDAKDHFISITEAYEFLISNHNKIKSDEDAYRDAMEDWRKYRLDRSRKRATVYAGTPYRKFKDTKFYKTTRIFDSTGIIFSFIVSIMVLSYTIYGYIYRLKHPLPGFEKPSVFAFIMLLLLGMIFFVVSLIYLMAYQETNKKRKKRV